MISQAANWFTGWRQAEWMEYDGQRHPHLDGDRFPNLPGAAIQVDSARNISFTGNVFTEFGAIGVLLHNDVVRATLDRNLFVDISAAALVAGHPVHDEIDEPMEGAIKDLVFTNNIVDRAAAEYYASVGVQITKASGAVVSHNLFRDLPYSALSLGWGWEDNQASTVHRAIEVENNYFENVVNLLYDGAPIYLLGPVAEPGAARRDFTQIRGNFANNADAAPQFKAPSDPVDASFAKRPGIQLDKGTRNILMVDNVFAGATRWLQVTAWRINRDVPGWVEGLTLIGRNNWSDISASEPGDTSLVGVEVVQQFSADDMPAAVRTIIAEAGLEPGVVMPPLPS
ncbi:MAG: right-handed parallel beta-helix repeat-containing protein [bacterium]|nr:right-handed parallel beta-helix repeat-containing protein [bacterium]